MEKIIQWDRKHSSRFLPTALLIPDKELANLQAYLLKHDLSMNRCLQLLLEDHVSVEEASIANLRLPIRLATYSYNPSISVWMPRSGIASGFWLAWLGSAAAASS